MADERKEVKLPAGTIRYREAGQGKPVVFVHGYLVDGRLWSGVVDRLSDRCRCLAPDWPIGAQQVAMNPDADLSPPGLARLIADFLDECAEPELRQIALHDAPAVLGWDRWREIGAANGLGLIEASLAAAISASRVASVRSAWVLLTFIQFVCYFRDPRSTRRARWLTSAKK